MARFIIKNKVYDTSKMTLIGRVKKWYEYKGYFMKRIYGEGYGAKYDCDLYRSEKGNWLLVHDGEGLCIGEAISEEEAKSLLMKYDYDVYAKEYGELEEA